MKKTMVSIVIFTAFLLTLCACNNLGNSATETSTGISETITTTKSESSAKTTTENRSLTTLPVETTDNALATTTISHTIDSNTTIEANISTTTTKPVSATTTTTKATTTSKTTTTTTKPSTAAKIRGYDPETTVYVSKNGHKIHRLSDCSGMKKYTEMKLCEADDKGYEYCSRCW